MASTAIRDCHLLVWGIYRVDISPPSDHPLELFDQFDVQVHQIRWLPVEWTQPSFDDIRKSNEKKVEIPKVNAALWIALAEVFPK